MPVTTVSGFVEGLLQSPLLDVEQREEVLRLQETMRDARTLAQELLRREWLTAFQINQIFLGKAANLQIGPYLLLERLGEGGMGQVFKAQQKMLQRVVALKVIRPDCLDNPKAVRRFQREIRAASQLNHIHIVRAYDADEINGTYYFAMELVDGVDLAKMVKDQGPLPVNQACEYIRQAALGLQHAQERGLVHRDIKPANLLVARAAPADRRRSSGTVRRPAKGGAKITHGAIPRPQITEYPWGVVKILDLGLARLSDPFTGRSATHLTQIGSVMGTPDFIAPEQARDSHSSDIRADLYSLGCTLYFLLTGQAPFPQGTMTEKLLMHQFNDPEPLEHVRATRVTGLDRAYVPSPVVELVRCLMAKQPEDRLQTPQELANVLQSILKQLVAGTLKRPMPKTEVEGFELATTKPMGEVDVDLAPTISGMEMRPIIRPPMAPLAGTSRGKWGLLVLALLGGVIFLGSFSVIAGLLWRVGTTQANPVGPGLPGKLVGK